MRILIIILIFFSLNCKAQHSFSEKNAKHKRLALYTLAIGLDAVGDALNDEGYKDWGHACDAMSIGAHLYIPFDKDLQGLFRSNSSQFKELGKNILIYSCIRFAIFNIIYNSVRGLPLNYVGTTDFIDKSGMNNSLFLKGITLTLVISLNYK